LAVSTAAAIGVDGGRERELLGAELVVLLARTNPPHQLAIALLVHAGVLELRHVPVRLASADSTAAWCCASVACAWSRADWSWRGSIVKSKAPDGTIVPLGEVHLHHLAVDHGLDPDGGEACTLPMARTWTGTSRCATSATVTGNRGRRALGGGGIRGLVAAHEQGPGQQQGGQQRLHARPPAAVRFSGPARRRIAGGTPPAPCGIPDRGGAARHHPRHLREGLRIRDQPQDGQQQVARVQVREEAAALAIAQIVERPSERCPSLRLLDHRALPEPEGLH